MDDMILTVLLILAFFGVMGGGLYYHDHVVSECRITAIQKGMSADDIVKLCK